jgi:hypothetical protein
LIVGADLTLLEKINPLFIRNISVLQLDDFVQDDAAMSELKNTLASFESVLVAGTK